MDYLKLAKELSVIKRKMGKIPAIQEFKKPHNGESFVLRHLYESKTPVTSKEIGKSMNVSSARMARVLNQLEEKDMIRRKRSEDDARHIIIEILDKGIEQCLENENEYNKNAMLFLKALGEEDAKEYVRLQNRIVEIYIEDLLNGKKDKND